MKRGEKVRHLFKVILKLQTIEDCEILFEDLCTYKEIENMAERIEAAELLIEGKTYSEVINRTAISSATLSRVSKCVQYGEGYKKFLKKG
ncbi:MAG: hypothetical protein LBD41_06615 [Clostridiales Family XIII bacterium]|jgi:TrpR-related protein YerC/YecD|nr:hypothetical protein [Clostridiales Family XIII bacterium]